MDMSPLKDFLSTKWSTVSRSYPTILIVLVVSLLSAFICRNPFTSSTPSYAVGEIARKDIRAPENIHVVDEELTDKRRATSADLVLPVFDFDPQAKQSSIERLSAAFELISGQSPQKAEKFKGNIEEALGISLSSNQWKLVRDSSTHSALKHLARRTMTEFTNTWILEDSAVPNRAEILLRDIRSGEEFKVSQKAFQKKIVLISEVREQLHNPGHFKRKEFEGVPENLHREAVMIVSNLVEPDLVLNEVETKARQDEARNKVESVWAETAKGEIIVREGQRIDRRNYLLLHDLQTHKNYEFELRSALHFGALFFCLIFLCYFLGKSNFKKFRFNFRDRWVLGTFFVVSLALVAGLQHLFVAAKGQTLIGPSLIYLLPLSFAGMTVRLFSSMEITTFFIILFSLAVGWMTENPYYGVISFGTSLAGAGQMRHISQRFDVFRAGLSAGGVKALLCVIGLGLTMIDNPGFENAITNYLIIIAFSMASGIISSGIILGVQPLLEYVGYTTDLRLMELASTNHPLLKDLIMKAPGTYFHSFTVSQLAEKAAEAIHANALFVRVASLYHDIGKIKKPQYFIENIRGENRHDKLVPTMSALIISNHVKDGIELGLEHNLPQSIIEVIPQHHGTSLISYFYDKAKKQAPEGDEVEDRDFRYPGPKPQTRESAIVLLADAAEATAKSLQNKSSDILSQMVHQTIQRFFLDGQLDECELTLKDLNAIGNAFLQVLQGVYHQRIDYPHLKEDQIDWEEKPGTPVTKIKPIAS